MHGRSIQGEIYVERLAIMPAVFLFILMAVFVSGFILTMVMTDAFLDPGENLIFIAAFLPLLIVPLVLLAVKVKITLTYEYLSVGVFKGRTIPLRDIDSVALEEFSALKDFGGWGYRLGKKGWGYIAAGTNKGLRINFKNGKSLLVSTKNPFDFESAVKLVLRNFGQAQARSAERNSL